MASSTYNLIPYIIGTFSSASFTSLLDVGIGFGKWGVLVREYYDFSKASNPNDLLKQNWRIRVDGIEVFPDFISDLHRYIYNEIYVGPAQEIINTLGKYDFILMVAVLAHFPRDIGLSLVEKLYNHANEAVVLTIPTKRWPQDDIFENPYEVHHDVEWWKEEFTFAKHVTYKDLPQGERIVVLSRDKFIEVANPYRSNFVVKTKKIIKGLIGDKLSKRLVAFMRYLKK